jgi:hypothetical protein
MIDIDVHFVWIMLPVVVAMLVLGPRRRWALRWMSVAGVLLGGALAYLVISLVSRAPLGSVTAAQLAPYRTRGDGHYGLVVNVLGLYGFWRPEPALPKHSLVAWPLLLVAMLVVSACGAARLIRGGDRRLAAILIGLAVCGLLLSLGDQGPLGSFYRAAYEHLPGFAVMREPQKFIVLLAVAYAVLFGIGAEVMLGYLAGRWMRAIAVVALVALPVLYTPTMFGGYGGRIQVSRYPSSWYEADRLMGRGQGKLLFLPFHLYQGFAFTAGRAVSDLSTSFFQREVFTGEDAEDGAPTPTASPPAPFLQFALTVAPRLHLLGRVLAPLGIEYVAVAQGGDFPDYRWVADQRDLRVVLRAPDLLLYRVTDPSVAGVSAARLITVPDWGALVAAEEADEGDDAFVVVDDRPGALTRIPPVGGSTPPRPAGYQRTSPVGGRLSGPPGSITVIPEAYASGWRLDGRSARSVDGGTIGFIGVSPSARHTRYQTWSDLKVLYAVTVTSSLALFGLRWWPDRVRRRRVLPHRNLGGVGAGTSNAIRPETNDSRAP